jgi:hypothetical protein
MSLLGVERTMEEYIPSEIASHLALAGQMAVT